MSSWPSPSRHRPTGHWDRRRIDTGYVSDSQLCLALRSTLPLAAPQNLISWRHDSRISLCRNLEQHGVGSGRTSKSADDGGLGSVHNPSQCKRECSSLGSSSGLLDSMKIKPLQEIDFETGMINLGMDSCEMVVKSSQLVLSACLLCWLSSGTSKTGFFTTK